MKDIDAVVCLNNMIREINFIKLKNNIEHINQKFK